MSIHKEWRKNWLGKQCVGIVNDFRDNSSTLYPGGYPSNEWLIPPIYDEITECRDGYIVTKGSKKGIIGPMYIGGCHQYKIMLPIVFKVVKPLTRYCDCTNYLVAKQKSFWDRTLIYGVCSAGAVIHWLLPLKYDYTEISDAVRSMGRRDSEDFDISLF